jgi:hypothetical protein
MKSTECGFGEVPEHLKSELRFSPSKIKDAMVSLKNYKYSLDKGKKPTAAMELGTLLHMAILEPERFAQTYVKAKSKSQFDNRIILDIADDFKKFLLENGLKVSGKKDELIQRVLEFVNNPEYKGEAPVIWDIVNSCAPDQILMSEAECEMVDEIQKEIENQPFTKELMRVGEREKKMWFREPETGVIISMRVDFYAQSVFGSPIPVVLDVKKVADASPFRMQKWLSDTFTGIQLVINRDCIRHITGKTPTCMILALDTKAPFNVVPYTLDNAVLEICEYQYKQKVVEMIEAHKNNKFLGISDGTPLSLSFPHYIMNKEMFNEGEAITA